MALDRRSKVFAVREARATKLLTDLPGATATYAQVSSLVVATPAPTTTTFSVTPGDGTKFAVGRTITVNGIAAIISAIATDAITLDRAITLPVTGNPVVMASSFAIPGAKNVKQIPAFVNVDLRGDNTFLDTDSMLQDIALEIDYAKMSFDLLNLVLGGTIVETGTTPNQTTVWSVPNPPVFGVFRVEARCSTVDTVGGDLHITWNKVKVATDAGLPQFVEENYPVFGLKMKAYPPLSTTPWQTVQMNETALGCL